MFLRWGPWKPSAGPLVLQLLDAGVGGTRAQPAQCGRVLLHSTRYMASPVLNEDAGSTVPRSEGGTVPHGRFQGTGWEEAERGGDRPETPRCNRTSREPVDRALRDKSKTLWDLR